MSSAVQENRPLSRAVRKIKCAAMVSSLAKSWQTWAGEHSGKQDSIPKGWFPSSVTEERGGKESEKTEAKPFVAPRAETEKSADRSGAKIRTGSVSKGIRPKKSDCGNDLVSFIAGKINTNQIAPSETKPFLGNTSPTRRRYCGSQAVSTMKTWRKEEEQGKLGSRSSSIDTEDSGLGEEGGSSETDDENKNKDKPVGGVARKSTRPKIKVSTMGDLRSNWQKWSEQHSEQQKLNPFSKEFDYEHAMACRLLKGDQGYGRPKEGSKTAERARRAERHIHKEMEEMCFIIRDMGVKCKDERVRITFGGLFDRYVKISDKVVGILLRCRKHGMVQFEGEMLWKGQDDDVIITLLV
ncbi:actin-binding Rho-activating protein-like [Huso huso]|uniref:Actin-binding Rho-activating protein-like n=1 Tax=Huso huso TaxID=61971 RepID=A0ABR0Z426_HUSHU